MDQSDTLGHGIHSASGSVSDASAALSGMSDFQPEDMDTAAQPSEVESHSDLPMTGQDTQPRCSGPPDSEWGEGESEASKHHCQYPKISPYLVVGKELAQNRWYEGEDIMDPRQVASPVCRMGSPNVDGSIGGDKGYPLPPD